MTEEDIKAKIILPYLQDIGFDVSEITLEKSFKIRLGKTVHATGRLDILCKRHNRSLFVIELKSDTKPITNDDRDQGISYARLLDEIAPFTIVSNGLDTKIYDSITKEELNGKISEQSAFWKSGYSLSADEEIRIRYEALKNVISLTPENLKTFCEAQVNDRMGMIIGDIDSPFSKFVKELFIQREELQIAFNRFLNSAESTFGLVGNAGVGKTNAICSLTLQNFEESFVFFYNAAIINSPIECIAQDLNLAFSNRTETDTVLKKLNDLGRLSNKKVLIFIDAIDENTNPTITHELSELALAAKNLEFIKIIVSCKSNIFNSIVKINDTPTHLYEELKKSHRTSSDIGDNPGFILTEFTDKELKDILPLYQKAFDFKGVISDTILKELKNGFFLKIFCEVYSGKSIPNKISDKELIKKYLKQSLDKTGIGFVAGLRILSAVGKIIIDHEYTSWQSYKDEGLDINQILEKLNFSLDENIPEDLFTRNILIKSNTVESYNISFYYSKIRDYIICFHSYQLDKLSDHEFYDVLSDFYQNHIGKSAIDFYIENAKPSHLDILVKFKKDKALSYVEGYNLFLEKNFKKNKSKFDPYTNGDIAILLPRDLIHSHGYGLLPLENESDDKLIFEDFGNSLNADSDVVWQMGVKTLYGSYEYLLIKDQTTTIKKNILKELKKIMEKGGLTAYNSNILLMEEIAVIVYYYYKELGYDFNIKDFYLPRFETIYPLDLVDLKQRINRWKFVQYYRYKATSSNNLYELVEIAINENHEVPQYNTTGDTAPFKELGKIVDILLEKGINKISTHYLPLPNKSIEETKIFYQENSVDHRDRMRIFQYSQEQAKIYFIDFFTNFEICYKEFVEDCFPTFKNEFPFYNSIPNEYFFYTKDGDINNWGMFGYRPSITGKFEMHFEVAEPSWELGKKEKLSSLRTFSLDRILKVNDFARYPVKTVDKINTSDVDEYCVLRNWIYMFLEDDLKRIFEENSD